MEMDSGYLKAGGICGVNYPVLLVHGIGSRDWKRFQYWGRIPARLAENGARIYYGGQQSAVSVEQSGAELKERILEVLAEAHVSKVNIIAHSKGGLDARYAISCLGMAGHVASLTTINTPHRGSALADALLEKASDKFAMTVGKGYNSLFAKLGDDQPDFLSAIHDLTEDRCRELNEKMPDRGGVYYQSVGSKMASKSSAPFPFGLSYGVIAPIRGDNDGLVSVDSMEWGNFLGVLAPAGRKGICHVDMVDRLKRSIPGFDVCEFYIRLVRGLKEKGL